MGIELGGGTGPLRGVRVVELAGIGPGPHACMLLADLGADVIRVDRRGGSLLGGGAHDILTRGRPSIALDLKHPDAVRTVLDLVASADVLVEGMRPGAAERLGLGPEECHARNPRLVYGRMTGWGQDGPLAHSAGHDMNYISVAGALFGLGQDRDRPHFPQNLLGDFGGGSTYLVIGILAALLEARGSGQGQVVDAAIVDGTAHLNAMGAAFAAAGMPVDRRTSGLLDGGVPYYDVYETADGRHMSVAPLEGQFYAEFARRLGLPDDAPDRDDLSTLADLRALIAARFQERPQAEWVEVFEGTDACVAGIISLTEAFEHPHNRARETFVERDGITQPAPAPRFSRTTPTLTSGPSVAGGQTRDALEAWGITNVDDLLASGAATQA
ncbi:MAG TPA: CaiB/BaiF CoA-transferase family protein [Marmoricola sp.]|jgi:alpha-methylacyl-CoA racemase|nr:CaiB/BaiF CoA-transferase family protein [Marmoricola sp.]